MAKKNAAKKKVAKKKPAKKAPSRSKPVKSSKRRSGKRNGSVSTALESMADEILTAAKTGQDPFFDIPIRSLSNVNFNKKKRFIEMGDGTTQRNFFNLSTAKKFMQTMLVADALMELQRRELTTSLREIYYRTKHTIKGSNENTVDQQSETDGVIEDLEVLHTALREELHVSAEGKGALVGPVTLIDDGDTIHCDKLGKGGYAVPSIVEPENLRIKRCTAKFLLLVEKGTMWNRLSEDRFWKKHNCAMLTGNGQPPRGVRRLARRFHEEYKLPVLVLVDNDPWGYYIYSVVKQGSISLAFESKRMAIPDARFVGLSSFDPIRHNLPRNVGIVLNSKDVTRCKEIRNYEWFSKKHWQREIKQMLDSNLKYELDTLANKDFQYLSKTYLPKKLKDRDWLD